MKIKHTHRLVVITIIATTSILSIFLTGCNFFQLESLQEYNAIIAEDLLRQKEKDESADYIEIQPNIQTENYTGQTHYWFYFIVDKIPYDTIFILNPDLTTLNTGDTFVVNSSYFSYKDFDISYTENSPFDEYGYEINLGYQSHKYLPICFIKIITNTDSLVFSFNVTN